MKTAAESVEEETCKLHNLGSEENVKKAKALWYMLIQTCKGKALRIVSKGEQSNGLLAWRRLIKEYKPKVGGRHNAMLVGLLSPQFDQGERFDEAMTRWSQAVQDYEAETGDLISERQRIAVITRYSPESAKQIILQSAAQANGQWKKFEEQIYSFYQASRTYQFDGRANDPMDVGMINSTTGCSICGRRNHRTQDCWQRGGKDGKGKGKEKHKGKNSKAKTKTKWKSKSNKSYGKAYVPSFQGECNYCKKYGHKETDCRKKINDKKKKDVGAIEDGVVQEVGIMESEYDYED